MANFRFRANNFEIMKATQLKKDLQSAVKEGYKFTVYVGVERGKRWIAEVSATIRNGKSLRGFSYGCDQLKQPEMRQIENMMLELNIPFKVER